jgi:hypothetical protein
MSNQRGARRGISIAPRMIATVRAALSFARGGWFAGWCAIGRRTSRVTMRSGSPQPRRRSRVPEGSDVVDDGVAPPAPSVPSVLMASTQRCAAADLKCSKGSLALGLEDEVDIVSSRMMKLGR